MDPRAEEIRLRYLYRRAILRGQVRVPLASALKLVGPDCAFHLYSAGGEPDGEKPAAEKPSEGEGDVI